MPAAAIAPLVALLLSALPFVPALSAAFVNFDDDRLLVNNPYLRQPAADAFAWFWTTTFLGHYEPLTWMSYWLDHAIAGLSPWVYHVDSIALHALAAALLVVVCTMLLARTPSLAAADPQIVRTSALLAGLLWAVHPLRVESVAWIAERRDPLSAVFLLLALAAYLRAAAPRDGRLESRRWFAAAVAFLLLSLLSKAWGMSFFVVLIIVDVYPLERLPFSMAAVHDARYRPVWREKVPFAVLGLAAAAVAWFAQHSQPDTMVSLANWGVGARILQSAYGLCFYAARTVWPARLAALYPLPASLGDVVPLFAASACIVAVVAALIAWRARSWPALAAAAAASVVIVLPVLGIAQSGPQLVADRYTYLSAMPLSAALAGAFAAWCSTAGKRLAAQASLGIVIVVLSVATWRQTSIWHDSISLWSHAIEAGHASYVAHLDYGQALRARGDTPGAIEQYRAALALRGDSGNAWYNLGNALKATGDLAGAEHAYLVAISRLTRKVDAQVNLGNLYFSQHRLREAAAQYAAAVATLDTLPPAEVSPEPYLYLGQALIDLNDAAAARPYLNRALQYPSTRSRAERELRALAQRTR